MITTFNTAEQAKLKTITAEQDKLKTITARFEGLNYMTYYDWAKAKILWQSMLASCEFAT